jgi:diamine N-acetyltransferase
MNTMPIHLRPTSTDDLDFVLAAENHQDNRDFIGQWSKAEHEAAIADPDMAHFVVIDGDPCDICEAARVGYVIVYGLTDPNQSLCIQRIVITEKGKGYGKATLRLIQKLAFETWNAHRLWLDVKDFNDRARHVYESVGFRFEGILRDSVKVGNQFESYAILSILQPEYQQDD